MSRRSEWVSGEAEVVEDKDVGSREAIDDLALGASTAGDVALLEQSRCAGVERRVAVAARLLVKREGALEVIDRLPVRFVPLVRGGRESSQKS
jgi:hypothetical protein